METIKKTSDRNDEANVNVNSEIQNLEMKNSILKKEKEMFKRYAIQLAKAVDDSQKELEEAQKSLVKAHQMGICNMVSKSPEDIHYECTKNSLVGEGLKSMCIGRSKLEDKRLEDILKFAKGVK